jgi:hypothetical protein
MIHKVYLAQNEQLPGYVDSQVLVVFWGDTWLGYILLKEENTLIDDFRQNDHITLNINDISFIAAWCLMFETDPKTFYPKEIAPDPETKFLNH